MNKKIEKQNAKTTPANFVYAVCTTKALYIVHYDAVKI